MTSATYHGLIEVQVTMVRPHLQQPSALQATMRGTQGG
jgi:hypothetical protein